MRRARVSSLTAVVLAMAGAAVAQEHAAGLPDPFRLLEPKDFVARRASSNNPDPRSNDDSKRPIPGETVVLADLEGPGVVSHIWLTVAASEYGWPRLLRLRVYYDGSATPSVDAPLGDFFAVGHGFERPVRSLMVRDELGGPLAQQLLADAVPPVLPDHGHQRGPPPRRQPLLPRGLAEAPHAARGHALLPRLVPAGAPRAPRRLAVRDPERRRAAATTSAP